MFLALAHISVLRNWCFLHLHTSGCYATDVSCTCTHLGATQLMFLALAHISVLRNWCFLHLHTSRCYAPDVSCTCTHLGATQLMFLALAHISVLRTWCFLHLHTSRCTMHQVKLHQTAFMANRVKWIRCKLQVIVDFSARFGEKNSRLDIVKTFHDQWHLKTWYAVYLWKSTSYMEKHIKINTMTTRTTNGCGYSSHVVTVDIVPSRANPPGGANVLLVVVVFFGGGRNIIHGSNAHRYKMALTWQTFQELCAEMEAKVVEAEARFFIRNRKKQFKWVWPKNSEQKNSAGESNKKSSSHFIWFIYRTLKRSYPLGN